MRARSTYSVTADRWSLSCCASSASLLHDVLHFLTDPCPRPLLIHQRLAHHVERVVVRQPHPGHPQVG